MRRFSAKEQRACGEPTERRQQGTDLNPRGRVPPIIATTGGSAQKGVFFWLKVYERYKH